MTSDPHGTTVRRFIDALNDRDLERCLDLLDDEVEWQWMDYGPMAGVHRGEAGMKRIIEQFRSQSWEMYRVEADEMESAGSRVLVIGAMRPTSRSRDEVRALTVAWLVTVIRGTIVRVLSYGDPERARRALERHRRKRPRLGGAPETG